ncbi:hypothetical protein AMTR_s00059p00177460 [Amborella trichopoda]|uniref:CASP-like protein n=1 Tax=Amborella trichopoda TaxID=13333 RepID=U5D8A0_AMBTC|nr:hypothetical protein AMTR_s00059p00177460 [Amborella trichopoda]
MKTRAGTEPRLARSGRLLPPLGLGLSGYVIMVMSLMIPWSSVAAVIDAFFAFTHHAIIYPSYLMFVVGVDWLLSVLSLSAACSMAGVTQALVVDHGCTPKYCARYQISCSLTFAAWVFIAISSLVNFWVLGSSMN